MGQSSTARKNDFLLSEAYRQGRRASQSGNSLGLNPHPEGSASGEVLLSDAYIRGRRAGKMNLSPALNPYVHGTPEAIQWEQGRLSAVIATLDEANRLYRLRLVASRRPPDDVQ